MTAIDSMGNESRRMKSVASVAKQGQEVDTSDITSGEVWRLRGVVGVTRPPSTPKDGAITTQNRLPNMIDHGTDI